MVILVCKDEIKTIPQRLQEARRLLFTQSIEAAEAAYLVGYESPSHFSREYTRKYGLPPMRDLQRLRETLG